MRIEQILTLLKNVKETGKEKYTARCPVHDDKKNSLSLAVGDNRKILLHCHAGCSLDNVLSGLGIKKSDLHPQNSNTKTIKKVFDEYIYRDLDGNILHKTIRYEPKEFTQARPDMKGGWIFNLKGVETIIYNLKSIKEAIEKKEIVYIVEGEKDADNLVKLGLTATTNPMGAGKWREAYSQWFKGADVVIIPDNDEPGRMHAQTVAKSLNGQANTIKVIDLRKIMNDLPTKADATDYFKAVGDKEKGLEFIARLIEDTVEWKEEDFDSVAKLTSENDNIMPPYVYTNHKGAKTVKIPDLRKYIKQNNIISFYQGGFRIYENGYYKPLDMRSFVYMEMPECVRSNKIAEQVVRDLQLDTDLMLNEINIASERYICFKNGVYDINTRQVEEHSSERIFVSQIPHNYNPNAVPDAITDSFLQNCCGSDDQQRKLLLEMIGVTSSDVRKFKNWFFIQGKKDTGKSTFCGVLQKLLTDADGTKQYSALPLNALDENEFGLAEVLEKKANIVTDTTNDPIKNLTTIKKLTGGAYEELNCKVKFGVNPAKGVSKAILIFAGNNIPMLWTKGDKTAFTDRMILLRFSKVISMQDQIFGLVDRLDYEYLIKLGIEALHGFIENNHIFTEPESVVENRQDVLFESDNVYKFFKEACTLTKGRNVHVKKAYQIFMYWCYENGYSEKIDQNQIPSNTFRTSIIEYGAAYKRSERKKNSITSAFVDFEINEDVCNAYEQEQRY